jgi:hypothetical protein
MCHKLCEPLLLYALQPWVLVRRSWQIERRKRPFKEKKTRALTKQKENKHDWAHFDNPGLPDDTLTRTSQATSPQTAGLPGQSPAHYSIISSTVAEQKARGRMVVDRRGFSTADVLTAEHGGGGGTSPRLQLLHSWADVYSGCSTQKQKKQWL